ncbi:MAG: tetratricopeptide repeat protein [Bacteroidetes bacterium]|nr:tetratricopeptide repeat protein [Bacteroidota bacterium]
MRNFTFIFIFLVCTFPGQGEKQSAIDSLESRLARPGMTSMRKFQVLNELTRLNWKVSSARSMKYGKSGLELADAMGNDSCRIEILKNLGVACYYATSFELALQNFFQALALAGKRNDVPSIGMLCNSIGNVYLATNMYDKALIYYQKSLEIRKKSTDKKGMAANYINISRLYSQTNRKEESWRYLMDAIKLLEETGDSARLGTAYNNLGQMYRDEKNLAKALEFNRKALRTSEALDQPWEISYIFNSTGEVFLDMNRYDSALACFTRGLRYARQINSLDVVLYSYRCLTNYYSATGNYKLFQSAFAKYNEVRDSIFTSQVNNSIAEMQVRYETEAKEKENALQKLEINRQRNLRNSFIFISILILIGIVILFYLYRMKRMQSEILEVKVAERTRELRESEQRILRNTIETEERERARFSEDLHDGLGPLLSTVKIHLELIRSRTDNREDQEKYIRLANELLDEAIRSTKEIANNLVPNVLNDFGLLEALSVYIDKINRLGTIRIRFTSTGLDIRPSRDIETAIYRIAFELINNTLKHAKASRAGIRIGESGRFLEFEYTDNGIGMNWTELNSRRSNGLGLPNIISRVKSLNGEYDFTTDHENPFGIKIRIPLTSVST